GTLCSEVWDAARENTAVTLPHSTRKIFTYDNTEVSGNPIGGIEFKWSSLNPTQAALLDDGDGQGEARVNYLRGDDSNEIENGGTFRSRRSLITDGDDTRVGPIVHSSPVYVGNGVDANGFREYAFTEESYSIFLTAIASRKPMIYTGGNDGMLHAFNAERNGGEEVFAYVPNAILNDVHELTESTFTAGAYVDGPISTLDVFFSGDWHSVLVGGLRTGGKGYYALDITDPTDTADKIALWEFTDDDDSDMGYSFGKAQLVKLNTGKWVAIVANGYNSTNEKAVLFVLDIEDGSVIKKFEVDNSGGNGLSGPVAISIDRDFTIEYIYAGDLQGNMWKFDLKSSVVGDWSYAKLFKADSVQVITGSVTVGNHPENQDGRLVYFGTGKYLEQSDLTSTNTESFYAVLDDDTCTGNSACITSSSLVSQTVEGASVEGRTITDNVIDWSTDKGWRLGLSSLAGVSERVVGRPALIGSLVIFNTIIPESGRCNSGGETFTFVIDRSSGGVPDSPTLDYNADGRVDNNDKKSGKVVVAMQPKPPSGSSKDPAPDLVVLVSGDGANKCINVAGQCDSLGGGSRSGRVRWRQLK
ncbi:MAG: pilus assembly protein, partial [Pseudomonadales bacterium]